MGQNRERSTPLTPQRAFVVQFHIDTDLVAGRMVGRVEHVVSGQSGRFSSMASLLEFIPIRLQILTGPGKSGIRV
jgi:hypothetical protein